MNIVTIDFDIIMEPCIEFYNNLVGPDDPLKNYIEDFSFLTNLPANLYIYEYLTNYITKIALNGKTDIYFIESHQDVCPIIEKYINQEIKEEVDLFNIDHHHDIGYDLLNWKLPLLDGELSCGNWVKYLKDSELIKNYYWIKNENSDPVPKKAKNYITKEFSIKDGPLDILSTDTQVLILCSSYEWIPPVYKPLFLVWNSLCSEIRERDYPLNV